jgi:hypothetical protein
MIRIYFCKFQLTFLYVLPGKVCTTLAREYQYCKGACMDYRLLKLYNKDIRTLSL